MPGRAARAHRGPDLPPDSHSSFLVRHDPGFETTNSIRFTTAATAAGPGVVPPTIRLARNLLGEVQLSWDASGCPGATDYGIYGGLMGDWTHYGAIDCHDDDGDLTETLSLPDFDLFVLVVPFNPLAEGSYGTDSSPAERPPGTFGTCVAVQTLTCP